MPPSDPNPSAPRRRLHAEAPPAGPQRSYGPAMLLGKLAAPGTGPVVVVGETVLLSLLALVLGLLVSPADPLWTQAAFPWAWLAPVIVALRYGPLAGLGGASLLLLGWLLLNLGHYDRFPQVHFLGGLILVMVVGEFSSLWQARTRRAEIMQIYLDQRLEHLVRQYYLLRLSHDRLEQELIGRPMSMRDALSALRGASASPDGASALLRLLSQYCQLESAALYAVADEQVDDQPLAEIGKMPALRRHDALLEQALETRKLCHISQTLANQPHSQYLVAAPLLDLGGTIYGVLVVDEMPFFSLQEENLQTINLLLGYYTDGLATQALSQPVVQALPECPPDFAFEAQRLAHVCQTTQVGSVLVALEFLPRAIERDLPQQVLRLKRELDESWLCVGAERQVLALLMPLGDNATAEGYINRIETWSRQRSGQPLSESGVFPHVIPLDGSSPIEALARIPRLAHGHG